MTSLSETDFQRLQESLVELKTRNYQLEETCKKTKSALGEATAKVTVLEAELHKREKIISKSKKANEVSMLSTENDSLRGKLRAQEEDFRHQNQTLLTELSKLVTTNEGLEKDVQELGQANPSTRPFTERITALTEDNKALKTQISELEALNQDLKDSVVVLKSNLPQASAAPTPASDVDEGVTVFQMGRDGAGISFRKQDSISASSPSPASNQLLQLQEKYEALLEKEEKRQQLMANLKKENEKLSLQVQESEKSSLASGASSSELERLQAQLQTGYTAFNDFKEKKAKELAALQTQMEELKEQSTKFPPEKFSVLETRVEELQEERDVTQQKLDEANKVCESRKSLLDEMAITLQQKTDEADRAMEELQGELRNIKEELQSVRGEHRASCDELTALKQSESEAKSLNSDLTKRVADLEDELSNLKEALQKKEAEFQESLEERIKIVESEKSLLVRDLNLQLEIARAQQTEFEDLSTQLREELKDSHEDRKIHEKKNTALIKDLKKQLLAEKQRNERLSDKMRECFSDPLSPSTSVATAATDPERSSISSWSMMSGNGTEGSPPKEMSSSPPVYLAGTSSPSPQPAAANAQQTADHALLLDKIASLQEERLVLEERIHMLEHSSAAMADELLRKATLIQHYCMEGGQQQQQNSNSQHQHNMPGAASNSLVEKEKMPVAVKKVVDLLSPGSSSSHESESRKELQRMQNLLEETLTKNMHLQKDLENMSLEVVRLSKNVVATAQ